MANRQWGIGNQGGTGFDEAGEGSQYQQDGGGGSKDRERGEHIHRDGERRDTEKTEKKREYSNKESEENEWWTESWKDHRGIDLSCSGENWESADRDGVGKGKMSQTVEDHEPGDARGGGSRVESETRPRKLSFDQVLPLVVEAETAAWRRGEVLRTLEEPLTGTGSDDPLDTLHTTLLRHGRCVGNIHSYFSNLELRKCCLNLAARTTFSNFRLVGQESDDSGDDNGSLGPSRVVAPFVDKLSEKDLEVYGQTVLCALFPILGVPHPPSVLSPEPTARLAPTSTMSASRRRHPSHDLQPDDPGVTLTTRKLTLTSDPGMTVTSDPGITLTSEADDLMTSVIPPETLSEVLRQAFGLSKQRAAKYERLLLEPYKKKTHAKVLVEELSNQFSLLENDKHSFYGPRSFLTREAYERWKHLQRRRLGDLINKFWHGSLPALKGSLRHDTRHSHDNYRLLLTKLMVYEAGLRGEDIVSVLSGALSTASLRLLKEFGLRYGVGELYRRAVYLAYLSDHFETEVWYIRHLNGVLVAILHSFPTNRNRVIMVHEEYNLLYKAVMLLHEQCEHSLTHMKRLFPNQQPAEGIGCLIDLLTNVLELKAYLLDKHQNPIRHFLLTYTKTNVSNIYERHKAVAMTDLKMDPSTIPTPALLSRLIAAMRDELTDYSLNYRSIFIKYFDLVVVCTQCFYGHIMEDVAALCEHSTRKQARSELDLRLLSLAYRLNQLDTDWKDLIPLRHQAWRQSFRPVMLGWLSVHQTHCERLTMQVVGSDKFTSLELQEMELRSPPQSRPPSSSAVSVSSLTLSERSAFAPVTPKRSRSTEEVKNPSIRDWLTSSMQLEASASFTPRDLTLTQPPEGLNKHQGQAKTSETSFIQTDTETSFTYRRRPTFLFDDDMNAINDPMQEIMTGSLGERMGDQTTSNSRMDQINTEGHSQIKRNSAISDQGGFGPGLSSSPREGHANNEQTSWKGPVRNNRPVDEVKGNKTTSTQSVGMKESDLQDTTGGPEVKQRSQVPHSLSSLVMIDDPEKLYPVSNSSTQTLNKTKINVVPPETEEDEGTAREQALLMLDPGDEKKKFLTASLECHAKSFGESFQYDEVKEMLSGLESSSQGSSSASSPTSVKTVEAASRAPYEAQKAAVFNSGNSENSQQQNEPTIADTVNEKSSETLSCKDNTTERQNKSEIETTCDETTGPGDIGNSRSPTLTTPTLSEPQSHQSIPDSLASLSGLLSISGSLIDVTTILKRVIDFGQVLAQTLYPLGWQTNEEHIVWVASPELEDEAKGEEDEMKGETLAARTEIYERIMQIVCAVVCLYADNLLCFDLCGTREHEARALAGKQMVGEVKERHEAGKIWGCRHMARGVKNCFSFVDKKTRYLTDRYEPISEEMTLRINNLHSLLATLPQVQTNLIKALDLKKMEEVYETLDVDNYDELVEDFVVVGTFPRCTPSRPGHECLRCAESYNSSWRLTADRSRTTSERSEGQRSEGQLKSLGQRSPEVFTKRVKTEVEQEENVDNDDEPRSRESACSPARHEDQPSEMASPKGLDTPQRSRSWRGSPQRSLRGSSELGSLRYLRGSWSSRTSLRTGSLHDRTEVVFGHCGYHMGKVQKALANILAYRVNLFFRRALSLLVSIGLPLIGVESRLRPLTSFLDNHLSALHAWLYEDTYRAVVDKLWGHIAKDFQIEAQRLISPRNYSEARPEILLQTIALFIKYFHQDGKGLSLPEITQKVSKPLYWLGLYTETTPHLISLYQHLYLYLSDRTDQLDADLAVPPNDLVLRMRCDLHGDKKCFSGQELVDWFIVHDSDPSKDIDESVFLDETLEDLQVKTDVAVEIGQVLLDRGVLSHVEEEPQTSDADLPRALIPRRVPNQPYPILSLDSYGSVPPVMVRARTNDSLTEVLDNERATISDDRLRERTVISGGHHREKAKTSEGHHRKTTVTSEGRHRERSPTFEGHNRERSPISEGNDEEKSIVEGHPLGDESMTFNMSCDLGKAALSSKFVECGNDFIQDVDVAIAGSKDTNTKKKEKNTDSTELDVNREMPTNEEDVAEKDEKSESKKSHGTTKDHGTDTNDTGIEIKDANTSTTTTITDANTMGQLVDTVRDTQATNTDINADMTDTCSDTNEGGKVPFYIDTTSPSASDRSEPASSVTSSVFQPSSHHFYRFSSICDVSPDITGLSYSSEATDLTPDPGQLERAKELYELYDVTPQLVLQVLSARRQEDDMARRFLKRVGAPTRLEDPWDEGPVSSGCFGCGS